MPDLTEPRFELLTSRSRDERGFDSVWLLTHLRVNTTLPLKVKHIISSQTLLKNCRVAEKLSDIFHVQIVPHFESYGVSN